MNKEDINKNYKLKNKILNNLLNNVYELNDQLKRISLLIDEKCQKIIKLKQSDLDLPKPIKKFTNNTFVSEIATCNFCEIKFQWGDQDFHFMDEDDNDYCEHCYNMFK